MGAIIWLASYPKSGNTWLRAFLHNLLKATDKPADINRLTEFCLSESSRVWYQPLVPQPTMETPDADLARIRAEGQKAIASQTKTAIFSKTHNMLGEWHDKPLHNMDITAGAVYVVRNPLDVVISMSHHFRISIDEAIDFMALGGAQTENNEAHIPEVLSSWSRHVKSWTQVPNPGLHVMRYEDMLDKPAATFGTVAKFLQVKAPPDHIQKAIRFSSFRVLKEQEKARDFVERPEKAEAFFREGRKDQWRAVLGEDQIRRIVETHREQMSRFGYVPKGY